MDMDDLEPRKANPVKRNLEEMSIADLNEYIQEMKEEIVRVQKAIEKKENARSGAESVFKK